jgi:WD40 repeat protein
MGVASSPDPTDRTIRIWDAETGAEVGDPLNGHTGGVSSVAYSPDGRRIISGFEDGTIRIWDAETGASVGDPLSGHSDAVPSVACSPDGRRIISGSN